MEPIVPWIWILTLSGQATFQSGKMHLFPGGALQIQRGKQHFVAGIQGSRLRAGWSSSQHRLNVGNNATGTWIESQFTFSKGESMLWYDVRSRTWAGEFMIRSGDHQFRVNRHPNSGLRAQWTSGVHRLELGNRWNFRSRFPDTKIQWGISGGWNLSAPWFADINSGKMQLHYRSQGKSLGQWRVNYRWDPRLQVSGLWSDQRWRLQVSSRHSWHASKGASAGYVEGSCFGQTQGMGGSLGLGFGGHRLYGQWSQEWTGNGLWEWGLQTQGNWDRLGRYQIQAWAQHHRNWSVQIRLSQGIQWSNSRSKSSALFPLRIEFSETDEGAQGLLILTEIQSGSVVRLFLNDSDPRIEKIPCGRYRVRFVGPEDWEYSTSEVQIALLDKTEIKTLTVSAKKLIFRDMNDSI